MLITGNLIYLEPFKRQHLDNPDYFQWLQDIEVTRYIGREEFFTGVSYQEVVDYVEGLWKTESSIFFAVHVIATTKFIGTAKLNFFSSSGMRSGIADLGLMIGDRGFWGRGIGTDVISTLSEYAFQSLGVRKLTAGAIASNIGVVRAFKRSGYVEEGFLKQQFLIEDTYHDQVLLARFSE